ncbi:MAG: diguanylate cyclase [Fretibacterium sp.]|nr:diguanylate cyclase [Fretibacterium sp.]
MSWFSRPEAQQEEKNAAHKLDGEIERRYGGLISSRAFLYAFVDPEGVFLLMNRGMRAFLGPAIPDTLFLCCAPEQRPSLNALLLEAQNEPVSAVISLLPRGINPNGKSQPGEEGAASGRSAGTGAPDQLLWMDVEFSPAELRGVPAVQIIGMDVTEWVRAEQNLASEAKAQSRTEEKPKTEENPKTEASVPPKEAKPKDPGVTPSERTGILNAVAGQAAVVNDRGVCLAANAPFILSFSEAKAEEQAAARVVGARLLDLIPEDCPENIVLHRQFPKLLMARQGTLKCRLSGQDGEVQWLDIHVRPVEWGGLSAVMLTCEDMSALHRAQEQLERVTSVDYATGVLNRQGMERLIARRVERAFRDKTPLSLILLDIDDLRRMNEKEGYAALDRALKVLPATLKEVLSERGGDSRMGEEVVGRWGGDEFMVLTSRSGTAARALANVLRDRAHGGAFNGENAMTLSVGVTELCEDMDVSTFVAAAFEAMTAARRSGGNRTVLMGMME